jgi:hypothetical protein
MLHQRDPCTVIDKAVVNDVRGAVLQLYNGEEYIGVVDAEAPAVGKYYVGNVVLDSQVMTANIPF